MLVAQFLGLGWYVAVCLVGGVGGGVWLDGRLGTAPLLTLVGLGLGLALAFYGLYQMVRRLLSGSDR